MQIIGIFVLLAFVTDYFLFFMGAIAVYEIGHWLLYWLSLNAPSWVCGKISKPHSRAYAILRGMVLDFGCGNKHARRAAARHGKGRESNEAMEGCPERSSEPDEAYTGDNDDWPGRHAADSHDAFDDLWDGGVKAGKQSTSHTSTTSSSYTHHVTIIINGETVTPATTDAAKRKGATYEHEA
jgi:hypothetical protein